MQTLLLNAQVPVPDFTSANWPPFGPSAITPLMEFNPVLEPFRFSALTFPLAAEPVTFAVMVNRRELLVALAVKVASPCSVMGDAMESV